MSFKQFLIEMNACQEAIDWVENRTIKEAWTDCHRGDWMLWFLEEMKEKEGWLDEKEIMLLGCWCARRALKYVSEGETRPLKAIEAKEKWARGETTKEEMDAARAAARSAARAAARSAAWASASVAARAAVWAANDSARAAAYAAALTVNDSAKAAVCDAAYDEELSIQADYIRTQFTLPA